MPPMYHSIGDAQFMRVRHGFKCHARARTRHATASSTAARSNALDGLKRQSEQTTYMADLNNKRIVFYSPWRAPVFFERRVTEIPSRVPLAAEGSPAEAVAWAAAAAVGVALEVAVPVSALSTPHAHNGTARPYRVKPSSESCPVELAFTLPPECRLWNWILAGVLLFFCHVSHKKKRKIEIILWHFPTDICSP